ncbi:extracellular solute-binding protein [Kribbella antibiotica]|uniref:Extracellular solute-binding protein n=1 Tax=Kribbella antibiotica TaxID=190195 RepID=A0A4R4ZL13_9ACTN|nr:extracellular solute-binding protein [Kribbella antibiotica]TDD59245.1 extracellular solute-binding protein [Kribbella antibiotica]
MRSRPTLLVAGAIALALSATACGASADADAKKPSAAASAASAEAAGGMDALVAAAKAEGQLNVIALPRNWANYGASIDKFKAKYGIKVVEANPEGSSQDEITAVKQLKGQDRAPDVLDIGGAFAIQAAKDGLLAPYKVATWADIPDGQKESDGKYVQDYGGLISIGYDAAKVSPAPTSFADLTKPEYKGKVALNGDPNKAGAAFAGVQAASLAAGGSLDDIAPGIEFFGKLKKSGNFLPVAASPATIQSGQTPIVIDWDYTNLSAANELKGKVDWKIALPSDSKYATYYNQAINANAPHPAAARLWQEWLFSDEGQNLFLQGSARPVRLDAMTKAGTIDKTAAAALPKVEGTVEFPTQEQVDKAKTTLTQNWAKSVG